MTLPVAGKDGTMSFDDFMSMLNSCEQFDTQLRKDSVKCHQCAQECFKIFSEEIGDKRKSFCTEKCFKLYRESQKVRPRALSREERNK